MRKLWLLMLLVTYQTALAKEPKFPDDQFGTVAITAAEPVAHEPRGLDKVLIDNGVDPTGLTSVGKKQAVAEINRKRKWFEAAKREARKRGSYEGLTLTQVTELGPDGIEEYISNQAKAKMAAAAKQPNVTTVPDPAAVTDMQMQILRQQQQSIWQMQRQMERIEKDRLMRQFQADIFSTGSGDPDSLWNRHEEYRRTKENEWMFGGR